MKEGNGLLSSVNHLILSAVEEMNRFSLLSRIELILNSVLGCLLWLWFLSQDFFHRVFCIERRCCSELLTALFLQLGIKRSNDTVHKCGSCSFHVFTVCVGMWSHFALHPVKRWSCVSL